MDNVPIPIIVLSTSGHNGVDWLHSLLDGHDELLILPAFSFIRTANFLKDRIGNKNLSEISYTTIADELVELLSSAPFQNNRRRLFSISNDEPEIFKLHLTDYLTKSIEEDILVRLFFGIHYSYAKINNINLKNKKSIVIQEHVPWHSELYYDLFSARFLFIVRDPRAALVGAWIRQKRADNGKFQAYRFDHTILYQRYFIWFLKYVEKKFNKNAGHYLYIIRNESLHRDFTNEMKLLCSWLGIEFSDSLFKQTFANKEWYGESVYLAIDDLDQPPPTDYYEPSKVESRWRNAISPIEIKMVEWLTSDIFIRFDYIKDLPSKKFGFLAVLRYFFLKNNYIKSSQSFYILPLVFIRNLLRRFFVLYFPNVAGRLFKFR